MSVLASAQAAVDDGPSAYGWRSVVDRFEQVAADHRDRPALVYDGTVLNYGELAERTAAVAAGLAERGAGPETLVGLLLPRGVDLVVALLATLRSGAAYLPLDPALPADRLAYMCAPRPGRPRNRRGRADTAASRRSGARPAAAPTVNRRPATSAGRLAAPERSSAAARRTAAPRRERR